jgi:hypothetical protein
VDLLVEQDLTAIVTCLAPGKLNHVAQFVRQQTRDLHVAFLRSGRGLPRTVV